MDVIRVRGKGGGNRTFGRYTVDVVAGAGEGCVGVLGEGCED